MNAKLVEQLARLQHGNAPELSQKARAFVRIYREPSFGWNTAKAYAMKREVFPVTVIGRDRWLFIAYLTLCDPDKLGNRHVQDAFHITQKPGMFAKLKALLISGLGTPADAHIKLVSKKVGIHADTLEALEILFFNVLDRAKDEAYLSEIVYPETRAVEMTEGYFDKTPRSDLILRAAYNHRDLDLVLKLAGITDSECRKECRSLAEMRNELASKVMANATMTADLGLINQPGVGMKRAVQLMKASLLAPDKSSQPDTESTYDLSASLAAALAEHTRASH